MAKTRIVATNVVEGGVYVPKIVKLVLQSSEVHEERTLFETKRTRLPVYEAFVDDVRIGIVGRYMATMQKQKGWRTKTWKSPRWAFRIGDRKVGRFTSINKAISEMLKENA